MFVLILKKKGSGRMMHEEGQGIRKAWVLVAAQAKSSNHTGVHFFIENKDIGLNCVGLNLKLSHILKIIP